MIIDTKNYQDKITGISATGQSMVTTSLGTQSYYSSSQIEEQNQSGLPWLNSQNIVKTKNRSMVQTLQIQLDNLRLTTTDDDDNDKDQETVNTNSSQKIQPELPSINLNNCMRDDMDKATSSRSGNGGLGQKRTYKELERWDVQGAKSTINFRSNNDDARSFMNKSTTKTAKKPDDNNSIRTLKFNSRLLQKASAAVDLISQKIEFKNLMN